jgi:hypothetical protein
VVGRYGFGDAEGLWARDYEWPRFVTPRFIFMNRAHQAHPCLDRDYDPALFEDAFPINYGACFRCIYPTAHYYQTAHLYSEKADVQAWMQGVTSEDFSEGCGPDILASDSY